MFLSLGGKVSTNKGYAVHDCDWVHSNGPYLKFFYEGVISFAPTGWSTALVSGYLKNPKALKPIILASDTFQKCVPRQGVVHK